MRSEAIESLIYCNREIEFDYLGHKYSITYSDRGTKKLIYVCEFNKPPICVNTATEVLKLRIGSKTLEEIFNQLPDSAFDIF